LCTGNSLLTAVENVRAAGIVVVVAAGNHGSACSTVSEEPTFFDAATSVGATTNLPETVASFSSRGPVTADGSGRLKPDISAPGDNVWSSIPGGGYGLSSGTSMATPHVAGAAALLMSAYPELIGDVDTIERQLLLNAYRLTTGQACGGVPGSQFPNNTVGWGRLDALAALNHLYRLPIIFR
jgi:subtilisin family serine protease